MKYLVFNRRYLSIGGLLSGFFGASIGSAGGFCDLPFSFGLD